MKTIPKTQIANKIVDLDNGEIKATLVYFLTSKGFRSKYEHTKDYWLLSANKPSFIPRTRGKKWTAWRHGIKPNIVKIHDSEDLQEFLEL